MGRGFENGGNPPDIGFVVLQSVLGEYGIDLTKCAKVLEVGSGDAEFLDYIREKGVDVVGVDIYPRGSKKSPQVISRIEQLPFPDESFDVVLSSQVFDSRIYDQDHVELKR